jgi:hypothetical protein
MGLRAILGYVPKKSFLSLNYVKKTKSSLFLRKKQGFFFFEKTTIFFNPY